MFNTVLVDVLGCICLCH